MIFEKKILEIYKKNLIKRNDDTGTVFYYSHSDFDGLWAKPYKFIGNDGQTLVGNFYFYGEQRYDRLVIFEHGMGGGHRSYMREIEILAKAGYTVLSYDKTGCMESEGEDVRSFAQSIADLDFCICSLRESDEYKDAYISVIGHSWGGLSTLNIGALHKDITHIVSLSAPISVKAMLSQFFSGIMKLYVPALMKFECEKNAQYADLDAVSSLENTQCKALIIHSDDDPTVKQKLHFDVLREKLSGRENTEFCLVSGKAHNPNYTADAVKYMGEFFAQLTEKTKQGYFTDGEKKAQFKASYDFARMTAQDMAVWDKILDFLSK